jgi:hypothetical protein
MIPGMPIEPESIATLPEAPPTLGRHECGERRNHRGISLGPFPDGPVVCRAAKPDEAAGPLNRKTVHRHEMRDDLPSFSRP